MQRGLRGLPRSRGAWGLHGCERGGQRLGRRERLAQHLEERRGVAAGARKRCCGVQLSRAHRLIGCSPEKATESDLRKAAAPAQSSAGLAAALQEAFLYHHATPLWTSNSAVLVK